MGVDLDLKSLLGGSKAAKPRKGATDGSIPVAMMTVEEVSLWLQSLDIKWDHCTILPCPTSPKRPLLFRNRFANFCWLLIRPLGRIYCRIKSSSQVSSSGKKISTSGAKIITGRPGRHPIFSLLDCAVLCRRESIDVVEAERLTGKDVAALSLEELQVIALACE